MNPRSQERGPVCREVVSAKVPCWEWWAQEVGSDSQKVFFSGTGSKRWVCETSVAWQDRWFGLRLEGNAQAPAECFLTLWSRTASCSQGLDIYWWDVMQGHGINFHWHQRNWVGSESFSPCCLFPLLFLVHVLLWCFASFLRQGCSITSIPDSLSSGFTLKLHAGWPPSSRYKFIY